MVCNHCGKAVNGGTYINGVFYCPWCAAELIQKMQVINPVTPTVKTQDLDNIPAPCRGCHNHPSNGGSGVCFCTLGCQTIC